METYPPKIKKALGKDNKNKSIYSFSMVVVYSYWMKKEEEKVVFESEGGEFERKYKR